MPIDIANPPIAAYEAVRATIMRMAERAAFRTPRLRRARPEDLAISVPHQAAFIPLDGIKRDMALRDAAVLKGWRFLILDRDSVAAAANAVESDDGGYSFSQLNEGPFVDGTEQAILLAEGDSSVQGGEFEPLLLLIPGLQVVALWLRDRVGDADLVVPIRPVPSQLAGMTLLPAAQFCNVLLHLAGRRPATPTS
jgi:hypothetical protein